MAFPLARAQQSPTIQTNATSPIAPLASDIGTESGSSSSVEGGALASSSGDSAAAQSGTNLLSGAETLDVGFLHGLRPIFDPALQFSEMEQKGIVAGQILTVSSIGGSFTLEQRWRHYHVTAAYHGAETLYEPSYLGIHYLPYQDGSFSQEILFGRWTLMLRDDALYSWESGFGVLFNGGPAQTGNEVVNSIQPSLASGGTITTRLARQVYNTAVGELDYSRSRRTTLTLVASDGLAHFLDPGYINSQDLKAQVGYNYALSAKNNIALTYARDLMTFGGGSSVGTDSVQVMFGRKITGRMAFQAAAGPQLLHFANFGLASTRQLSWSAFSALTYQWRHAGYSVSYYNGISAGSGVYFGSDTTTIKATANRDITKYWSASVNGGYAINKALAPIAIFSHQFNNWFIGADLTRQIGAQVHLGLSYGFQQQTTGGGLCPVLSCGLPGSFSQVSVSLQWHPLAHGR